MGEGSKIQWTNATWNPWHGCHHVSPGCEHCYMFTEKRAYGQDPDVVVRSKTTFKDPLKWKDPQFVFTCSWSDWFIKEADPWRDEAWAIVKQTPHLTYQILTKRIERAATRLPWGDGPPWPNVWLIVSVEDQETADRRIPQLLQLNAAVRGVSYEPALGPVDFTPYLSGNPVQTSCRQTITRDMAIDAGDRSLEGQLYSDDEWEQTTPILDWIIVGGESGKDARRFNLDWARDTIMACHLHSVPVFMKQLGSVWAHYMNGSGFHKEGEHWYNKKGGEIEEWPADLRVREWPKIVTAI